MVFSFFLSSVYVLPVNKSKRRDERRCVYHAGVNGGLLDVSGDAGDERISILKVGVEVRLWEDGNICHRKSNMYILHHRES